MLTKKQIVALLLSTAALVKAEGEEVVDAGDDSGLNLVTNPDEEVTEVDDANVVAEGEEEVVSDEAPVSEAIVEEEDAEAQEDGAEVEETSENT